MRTTRRAILADASAATVAIPGVTSAAAIASPDTELLALGVELDKINTAVSRQLAIDEANTAALDAKVEAATGIKWKDRPDCPPCEDTTGYWETHHKLTKGSGLDDDTLESIWGALNDRLFSLCEDILSHTAQSPAGLAVPDTRNDSGGG